MHLHGHLESIDDGDITFSDDLADRLAMVESIFAQRSGKAIDAYISAAGIDAPEQEPIAADDWLPSGPAQLNLAGCEHHVRHMGQRVQTRLPVGRHASGR